MGLDKGSVTYIHHYNVIQSIFTAYKNCSLYSFPPNLLATNDFIIVSIVLLFFQNSIYLESIFVSPFRAFIRSLMVHPYMTRQAIGGKFPR